MPLDFQMTFELKDYCLEHLGAGLNTDQFYRRENWLQRGDGSFPIRYFASAISSIPPKSRRDQKEKKREEIVKLSSKEVAPCTGLEVRINFLFSNAICRGNSREALGKNTGSKKSNTFFERECPF